MIYRGFQVSYKLTTKLSREDKNGETVTCIGYCFEVCATSNLEKMLDYFTGAKGFELTDISDEEAESFAREMVDVRYKDYCRMEGKS